MAWAQTDVIAPLSALSAKVTQALAAAERLAKVETAMTACVDKVASVTSAQVAATTACKHVEDQVPGPGAPSVWDWQGQGDMDAMCLSGLVCLSV